MPDSNATITTGEIIRWAFSRIGVDNPSTSDIAKGLSRLTSLARKLDKKGRWLWAISNTPSTLTLVADQQSYTVATPQAATNIDPYILKLTRVEIVLSTTNRVELDILYQGESHSTWLRQSQNAQPVACFLETSPTLSSQKLWFYPTPDAAYSIAYFYQRRLYDFDSTSDTMDIPRENDENLATCLSYILAPEYSYSGPALAELKALHDLAINEMQANNQQSATFVPQVTESF